MQFEIKGHEYRAAKLGVFEQFEVSKKLLPVLSGIFSEMKNGTSTLETALPKIANSISSLKKEDSDLILHSCLSMVSRKHMNAYTKIFSNGVMMFDDIGLFEMLTITAKVLTHSLSDFFQELQGSAALVEQQD